ncbi:hypothetical protein [Parendozoicomonas haliclonae]|uniref:hypothetical protein n=1 Tax=Parendozoicomonas haliclonae TaxID=1960125 RepID=UPI000B34B766|nr:hypothetical protein [Parendozoicomonas haliclonae]
MSYSAERFLDEQAGAIADNLGMMGITPAYTYTHPQDPWVPDDDEIHLPAIEPDSASTIDSLSDSLDLSESLDNG